MKLGKSFLNEVAREGVKPLFSYPCWSCIEVGRKSEVVLLSFLTLFLFNQER